MLTTTKHNFLQIDKEDVISDAREKGMDINNIADFRKLSDNYEPIYEMMQQYAGSFARSSAIGGVTTGIKGFTSSLAYAGIDTALLSLQLYRLAQRYAIVNGFDPNDSLHKNKMMRIYYKALGVNAASQAVLKHTFTNLSTKYEEKESDGNSAQKIICKLTKLYSRKISWGRSLFIPVVGGLVGVTTSYFMAKKTSKLMQKAYRQAYFENWR